MADAIGGQVASMKPTVINRHHVKGAPPRGTFYIGRKSTLADSLRADGFLDATALGNPYKPQDYSDPAECLTAYRRRLWEKIGRRDPSVMDALARIRATPGAQLACSCKPKPCHGDVLVEDWNFIVDALDEA